ncbi:Enoyl-CoA hydratase/isomerase family [Phytophthora cinnamomi]|uniref:Enoyl-CoA hydratase/isomerase family n=1 Tax=Phytophthora cinnamomi TaxID=4785 RepID=UPI0035593C27|nr:Enoyl-CoA hydratase/isomerase family [Phytophthora cinnamomi]
MALDDRRRGNPFAPLELTPDQQQHCQDLTFQLLDRTLRCYDERNESKDPFSGSPRHHANLDCTRWKQLKTQKNASLYSERTSITQRDLHLPGDNWNNPCVLLAVGTIDSTLDEVMFGLETPDFLSLQVRAEVIGKQSVDGAILEQLTGPTGADPFQFMGVTWMLLSMSTSSSISERFERSLALGKTLPPLSDNAAKLRLYALFKQAQSGRNASARPGMLDFVGRAKWDAWSKLGDMTQDDAKLQYIAIIDELAAEHGAATQDQDAAATATAAARSEDLLVEISEAGLLTIQLNRPKKFNAIDITMYEGLTKALDSSRTQDKVKAVLLKSTGEYFSSGNDLSMFTSNPDGLSLEAMADKGAVLLENVVDTFITYPKPIVAAVQGPAVGIATTILGLCDLVYVKETATFHTPFTSLGQSPEACSSLLLPRIMGPARANALLLLGEKLSAKDALDTGLATAVYGAAEFESQVQTKVELLLSRYPQSMQRSKALIRSPAVVKDLQEVNHQECHTLKELWLGPECMDAILKFQSRKN